MSEKPVVDWRPHIRQDLLDAGFDPDEVDDLTDHVLTLALEAAQAIKAKSDASRS